jgi:pyruvate kinase
MIEKANISARPVVATTQMLESMGKAPRPTRAEASDVINTVVDGADSVMLSNETSNGDYPINAVSICSKVCVEGEKTINNKRILGDIKLYTPPPLESAESVAQTVCSSIAD